MRYIVLLCLVFLAACSDRSTVARPSEHVDRGAGLDIVAYDMKDGVRCYLYIGNGLSCVKVAP